MEAQVRVVLLARRAAEILPAPPGGDDLDGARAWRLLVDDTVRRIAVLGGRIGPLTCAHVPHRRLTWCDLLHLADLPVPDDDADHDGAADPSAALPTAVRPMVSSTAAPRLHASRRPATRLAGRHLVRPVRDRERPPNRHATPPGPRVVHPR